MPDDTRAVRNSRRRGEVAGNVAIRVLNAKLGAWRSLKPQPPSKPAASSVPPALSALAVVRSIWRRLTTERSGLSGELVRELAASAMAAAEGRAFMVR